MMRPTLCSRALNAGLTPSIIKELLFSGNWMSEMMTHREIAVALIAVIATFCVVVVAHPQTAIMQSSVFDWNAVPAKETNVGTVRKFFQAPTATLDELELHVTT